MTAMASQYPDEPGAPRPWRTALILTLVAFLLGLAAMAWALTRWEPAKRLIADDATGNATAPAQLAAAPPGIAPLPTPLDTTSGQAQAIDLRVADLEGRMARIDLRAAAAAGNASRAEGLLVAFAARRAIDRGAGLGYIEGQLRERFAATQPRAVAAVIAAAQQPVTLAALSQGLDTIAPGLTGGGPDEGWWSATRRSLGSLFVLRRASSQSPAPDARLARARLMLAGGAVDGALAEVARLPQDARTAEWMTAARRYNEAHRALDIIEAAVITAPLPTAAPTLSMPTPMEPQ